MDMNEFRKFREDCVKGWERLAESGEHHKNVPGLSEHAPYNYCPACEIAKMVEDYRKKVGCLSRKHEPLGSHCAYCPIDLFRGWDRANRNGSVGYGCEYHPHSPYAMWREAKLGSPTERKIAAHAMTKLNWTYLPIYEFI